MVMRFKGQVPIFTIGSEGNSEMSDFRRVPDSDRGNDGYHDQGALGGYGSNDGRPFDAPADVKFATGYGASEAEMKQGYSNPGINEHPAYDKVNYSSRRSQPRAADEDQGNTAVLPSDWEFQSRNNRAKGFLVRRRNPTER